MDIFVAKSSGFCNGVKNAVETALNIKEKNVHVLGELIHNPSVLKEIRDKGVITVENLDDVPNNSTVIFRSHGVPESFYDVCKERNVKVIDCTCPFVKKSQQIVKEQYLIGKKIVIVGEKTHPEILGLLGWCNNNAKIINDIDCDITDLLHENVAIVCQTTFSAEKFEKIIKNIKILCEKTVDVFKTICYTTIGRQREAAELAKKCDAMLVIGGLQSSNTNKLYEVCKKYCKNSFRMVDADDLNYTKLKNFKSVGIVSGASTPNAQTQEVLLKMEEVSKEIQAANFMEEAVAKIDSESKFKKGQTVTATISDANEEGLLILLPYSKKEILLSKDELDCEAYDAVEYAKKIGETIELLVVELKPSLKLSQKMIKLLAEEEALGAEIASGKEFSIVCTGFNKGGLVGNLGTYSVFVPAGQIRPGFVKDLSKYEGKTLRLRALEVKKERNKVIIASQRVILQEEKDAREAAKAEKENAFFASINVGDVVEGKVERTTAFGAFVSVNGFDCLAHVSDLSWTGVNKPEDVLEIGKVYNFKVLKVDVEKKKVSIGYKQLQPQPWELAAEKYAVGDVIHGKVVRIVPFGAFVEVEKGIDGLVHVSQICYERIETPSTVLSVGEEVDAKIVALDVEAKKMNLSIKAILPEPERKPRAPKAEVAEGEEKPVKKFKAVKKDEDEIGNWNEGSISVGTSLADLIANAKNNK